MGQQEQDSQNRTARTVKREQDTQNGRGQPEQEGESKNETAGTEQAEQIRSERTGQIEGDSQNGMGQQERDETARTRQPEKDS
jgi:hypothetical protein